MSSRTVNIHPSRRSPATYLLCHILISLRKKKKTQTNLEAQNIMPKKNLLHNILNMIQ